MLSPEERSAVEAEVEQMKGRASVGVVSAEAMSGWNGEFVMVEVSGISVDMGMSEQRVSGEIVLSRESVLAAMLSMGQSLGAPDATAQFLSEQFGWEG